MSERALKAATYLISALVILAMIFTFGHWFSDAPWTQHGDDARNVTLFCLFLTIVLNHYRKVKSAR